MNILVTLDRGYLKVLPVMLKSLLISDRDSTFDVYVMNSSLTEDDFEYLNNSFDSERIKLIDIKVGGTVLADAPVTNRYPKEMYYRIFASKFLPDHVDKILYLDPDIIIQKPLTSLYNMEIGNMYFAAASHVGNLLTKVNNIRLNTDDESPYINSGVILMNIEILRKEQDFSEVFDYIEKYRKLLILPDQDVISAVYSDKIVPLDPYIYNMTEKLLLHPDTIEKNIDMKWIAENTAIIHFCGRNKPWKERYVGVLGYIWHYIATLRYENPEKLTY